MGHSTVIIDYLGVGVLASRPAVPNIETGCGALWFSTDVIRPSLWTGSSWLDIVGAAPAAGLVSSDGTIFEATTLGAGLGWASGTLTNTGVITFGGTGGPIVLGAKLSMTGNTLEVGAGAGGVVSVGGAAGTIGTTGNISVVSNTLTLAGMAAEVIPAAALVYSTGTHIAAAAVSADFSFTGGTLSLVGIEHTANKGAASGYAPLDGAGLVPLANLPPVLSEAIYFAGTWNAATGTTSLSTVLASGTGSAGAMFKVTTSGTTTLDGIGAWAVGDQAVRMRRRVAAMAEDSSMPSLSISRRTSPTRLSSAGLRNRSRFSSAYFLMCLRGFDPSGRSSHISARLNILDMTSRHRLAS